MVAVDIKTVIPFNKPYMVGLELEYIKQAVNSGKISGNGIFTKKCHEFFEKKYGFKKTFLTSSCTDALEMAAILIDAKEGDEVIIPSYTFVSTANPFILRGAKVVFVDSLAEHPNMDTSKIESLITDKTKAIVPVHYAGCACDMDEIMNLAAKYNLYVIEDAAQAIETRYKGKHLGSIGDLATISFHETKNIIAGEGGLLAINNDKFSARAEIIWEKGTDRSAFFRGEIDKYGWVDIGSSFLPSDIIAAFLYAQIQALEALQAKRLAIWNRYYDNLRKLANVNFVRLPIIPHHSTNNAHTFYLICRNLAERVALIEHFKKNNIYAVSHYISLHKSLFYKDKHDGRSLPNCDRYTDTLLRLPLYYELSLDQVDYICEQIKDFYNN